MTMNSNTLLSETKELESAYERWNLLYTQGGSDPFWADGFNLNLTRTVFFGNNGIHFFGIAFKNGDSLLDFGLIFDYFVIVLNIQIYHLTFQAWTSCLFSLP